MTIRNIAFPFGRDATSLPAQSIDDIAIEDNIRRIFVTPLGSRVMRPNVGSKFHEFVYESKGLALNAKIDFEVRRCLRANEPRVNVLRVVTTEEPGEDPEGAGVFVDVTYEFNGVIRTMRQEIG